MRKEKIIEMLGQGGTPIKGNDLAEQLGVTRQIVVKDIALLRAQGYPIIATPQGYIMIDNGSHKSYKKVFACQHDLAGMEDELMTIIACGAKVNDVIVEHPVYGEIQGNLRLGTIEHVKGFVEHIEDTGAEPLFVLTKGIHLHTIEADNEECLKLVEMRLGEKGFLVTKG